MLRKSINGIFIVLTVVLLAMSGGKAFGQKAESAPTAGTAGGGNKGVGDAGSAGIGTGHDMIAPNNVAPWAKSSRPSDNLELAPRWGSAGGSERLRGPDFSRSREPIGRTAGASTSIMGPPIAGADLVPPPKKSINDPRRVPPRVPESSFIAPTKDPVKKSINDPRRVPPNPVGPGVMPAPEPPKKSINDPRRVPPRVPESSFIAPTKDPVKRPAPDPRRVPPLPDPVPNSRHVNSDTTPPPTKDPVKQPPPPDPRRVPPVPPTVVVTDKYPRTQ